MTQAWWTSRTLWVLVLGFIFNILVYAGVLPSGIVQVITDSILSLLAVIFRWSAVGPLTATK